MADNPIRSQAEQLIEIAERKTQSLRTWGVDESKVNYDLEAVWLIRHLADALKDALAARDPQAVGRPNFDSFRQQVVNALPAHMNDVVEVGVAMEAIDMAAPLLAARDPRLPQPKGGDDPDALRMHKRQPLPDPRASATTGDRLEPAGDPRLAPQDCNECPVRQMLGTELQSANTVIMDLLKEADPPAWLPEGQDL